MRRRPSRQVAIAAAALLAAAAGADFMIWSLWRQQLQLRADLAALAGADAVQRGESGAAAARARLGATADLAAPPGIEHPPSGGDFAADPGAVRVTLTARRTPLLIGRLIGPSTLRAVGTAAVLPARPPEATMVVRVE